MLAVSDSSIIMLLGLYETLEYMVAMATYYIHPEVKWWGKTISFIITASVYRGKNEWLIFQSTDFDCTGHPESGKRLGKSGCVDPSAQVNRAFVKQNFKGTWACIHCATRWIIKAILLWRKAKDFYQPGGSLETRQNSLWRLACVYWCLLGKASLLLFFTLRVCSNQVFFYWCFSWQMIKQPKCKQAISRVRNIIETIQ